MYNVILFAGTTEGRELAEYLNEQKVTTFVCTATEYGESLIPKAEHMEILSQRLNQEEMEELFLQKKPKIVVDATHPFATEVSQNILKACQATNNEYLRLLRDETSVAEELVNEADVIYVDSVTQASEYLRDKTGAIFVTTGSKELKEFCSLPDYQERVYARILSSKEAVLSVMELGFEGKNLICMQGPFSEEINYEMLKQCNARYLVTKEAGKAGGFLEKIRAAKRQKATSIIIGRPKEQGGYSYEDTVSILNRKLGLTNSKKSITVVGIGIGSKVGLTLEAVEAIQRADIVFGASRMLASIEEFQKNAVSLYKKEDVFQYLESQKEMNYKEVVLLVSGDVGFYSAAKGVEEFFSDYQVKYVCGISSLSYFCSKIGKAWEDVVLISNHGKTNNTIDLVRRNQKVFSLMGGRDSIHKLLEEFVDYGFQEITIWVGENLGYEQERVLCGNPETLLEENYEGLIVLYIENPLAKEDSDRIPDEEWIRGNVPMTKEEVRTVSLSKLGLLKDSIVYDIGAGTGSVAIQAAMKAYLGHVYAIEKNPEGVQLIQENKKKFKVTNVHIVEGVAPDAMYDLPKPTHAFIGGSSGNMEHILSLLKEKNQEITIVINAITLETVAETLELLKKWKAAYEIVQVQTARSKQAGPYHMMLGQNPVYIITVYNCTESAC